jgi:hypothetical protein
MDGTVFFVDSTLMAASRKELSTMSLCEGGWKSSQGGAVEVDGVDGEAGGGAVVLKVEDLLCAGVAGEVVAKGEVVDETKMAETQVKADRVDSRFGTGSHTRTYFFDFKPLIRVRLHELKQKSLTQYTVP